MSRDIFKKLASSNYLWTAVNLSLPFLTAYFFIYKEKSES
ncbi:hypothetical protein T4B_3796 [Trichinella pseudospiralis]|uniref:Uncharacterized protein n=1 Tax=Trichinella pseudospiralis TaxID=6337 RepID=A0A0V1GGY0_TRIPS|nr:hypothetical protein T4B_3796 [Trichinella pseudospiralis]KRY99957.1 hypothetical protein T4C_12674 [Trichinella pseudospiralis]KRZ02887.1 hypothetical protein T4C_3353 [Trichinella pseudospiralis]